MSISVSFNAGRLVSNLNLFASLRKDVLLRMLGAEMLRRHEERVSTTKRDPDRVAWAPLADATVEKKGSSVIMIETSALLGSFGVVTSGNQAIVSNAAPYITFHQTGTRHMPRRAVMGLGIEDKLALREVASAYIRSHFGRAA